MLTHPTLDIPPLVEPCDLDGELPDVVRLSEKPLRAIVDWAYEYLCRPHPELGRKGDVCPFTESALARNTFYLAVCAGVPTDADEVARTVGHYRDWFLDLPPTSGTGAQFKTILLLFPDLAGPELHPLIDAAQRMLKPTYVSRGLMIGEFHDGPPDKAGLWNSGFRPLRSPVPLLAIRHMVPTDFPFLSLDAEQVAAYLQRFGDRIPTHLQPQVNAATARMGKGLP